VVKQLTLTTQLANASLPRHKKQLQQQYGALADAVLAEAVSGRAWGLPTVSYIYMCIVYVRNIKYVRVHYIRTRYRVP